MVARDHLRRLVPGVLLAWGTSPTDVSETVGSSSDGCRIFERPHRRVIGCNQTATEYMGNLREQLDLFLDIKIKDRR